MPIERRPERRTGSAPNPEDPAISSIASAPAPRHRVLLGLGIAVLTGVVAIVAGWFRLPAIARDTLWAEDSRLFLQQRVDLGPWRSLFQPYDGYQHLVARVLTDVAAMVSPLGQYAHAVTILALVAVGATAAATYAFTGGLVRTRVARILLALVPVLLPLIPIEALGTFANLHWFGLFLAPFALLYRPPTRVRSAWQTFALFSLAMTEIQAVVFLPLLLLCARSRRSWPGGIAFVVGLGAQFTSFVLEPRHRGGTPPLVIADTVRGFFVEPSSSIAWPDPAIAAGHFAAHGWLLVVAGTVPFVLAAAIALAARWTARSTLVVVLLYGVVAVWFVDTILNPTDNLLAFGANGLPWIGTVGYVRYALVPSMFLLAIAVLAADRLLAVRIHARAATGTARRWVPAVLRGVGLLVLVLVVAVVVWRFTPYSTSRSLGPDWQGSVETTEQQCTGEPATEKGFIAGAPAGWGLVLTCGQIEEDQLIP